MDTFVSLVTPLELPIFAFAPLRWDFVLRGLDDGSLTPPAERDWVHRIARTLAIPAPVGTTNGSAIAPLGAPNAGLSWPGRYSLAPGEVLNLRDVEALIRIIAALTVR